MVKKNNKIDTSRKDCLKCKKSKKITDFYMSNSPNHSDNKFPVCKACIREGLKLDNPESQEAIESVKAVLLEMNRPFLYSQWISSVEESARTKRELFGMYYKNVILNYKTYTWLDSEFEYDESQIKESSGTQLIENPDVKVIDNRSKDDVLRLLGYDPFEHETKEDKHQLYNKLVDFLDESTLEDGFKLQAVIEIVKGFNQIDKINHAITNITSDIAKLATNSGGIKSLIDSKKNILQSLMKLAEDNGISVKHNNQKSKGAGTLSGIIKTLNEKGIESAEINIFDIETCEGMKQVADISNKSILEQLMLNENDYSEMIKDQKELINNYDKRLIALEEENRLIKIKLKYYEEKEKMTSQEVIS